MIKIYTDGATSNNGYDNSYGGAAYIILNENNEIIHSNKWYIENATNNICELQAVIESCKKAYKLFNNDQFEVYSDSAYIINCYTQKWWMKWINNGWLNSKKEIVANRILWEELIPFFDNPSFNFKKTKGHADDKWNNLVDKMAVEAKTLKGE